MNLQRQVGPFFFAWNSRPEVKPGEEEVPRSGNWTNPAIKFYSSAAIQLS